MLLPNVSSNVLMFCQWVTIGNNTQTVVGFDPVQTPTYQTIKATIQTADPERLRIDNVDFSLKYIYVHSLPPSVIKINDTCVYQGLNYKCIVGDKLTDYGYLESIFEEVKVPLVVAEKSNERTRTRIRKPRGDAKNGNN
jgi:hypothetical protein